MRKSTEFAFPPKPLSGMARNSPGCRPSTIEEKPCTGWPGRGKVMPLIVPGLPVTNAPDTGGPAYVATGRTARPTRTGPGGSEPAGLETARGARRTGRAASVIVARFARFWRRVGAHG